ncbi:MAG: hypothetical protein J7M06_00380, partial [Proteobacteria bacterium]|nr:hypothetical protein [Pseudomonadota bacterium]
DSRGQGFEGSSDTKWSHRRSMLKNYKELKVWQKSYKRWNPCTLFSNLLSLSINGLETDLKQ